MSELIVGIDLGTTNSLVAVCQNGVPMVLADENGHHMIPSVIHLDEKKGILEVGIDAKKQRVLDSKNTAYSVKRFIGKGKNDLDSDTKHLADTSLSTEKNIIIKLGDRHFSAVELSSEILKKLKSIAEFALKQKVRKAVVTVPAYFNDSQRLATQAAGSLAGLEVVRIVNEPTAAALAYGLNKKKNGIIAVYDLGGGTFDISILRLHDGIFEVLATNGDTQLGGDDFDHLLIQSLEEKIAEAGIFTSEELEFELQPALGELAERFKKELSLHEVCEGEITWKTKSMVLKFSRNEFEIQATPLIEKTIQIVARALKDAGVKTSEIDEIVMVGGSTRIPLVQTKLSTYFGKALHLTVNPDEVVALGAAIQADILAGKNQDMVLLDIVPLSLGIETYGGTVGKLIHRNSKIPCVAKETFTTHVEGQKNVLIHVLQGERELATDCRSLARFDLKNLPAMPAGLPKIEVTFLVDANGILKVRARELTTQTESAVTVQPSYGLTDEEVEKMLSESFEFAEQDMKARQLIDTRVEAQGILNATEKILKEASGLAKQGELEQVQQQVQKIRNLMALTNYVAIREALDELEIIAKGLAERVMNTAIGASLKNRQVSDVLKRD